MKKIVLVAIGVIGLVAGCCHEKKGHIHGICDCDPRTWGCRTGPTGIDALVVMPKESLAMPKEMAKQMP